MAPGRRLCFGWPLLALATTSTAAATDPVRTHRVSERSFEDTIQQLEWGFGGYGITVVARLDHQSLLEKEKESLARSVMFLIMRRAWGKVILENDSTAALDMPLHVHVYQGEDGKTVVSHYQPSSLFRVYGNIQLTAMGEELDRVLQAIVGVAVRSPGLPGPGSRNPPGGNEPNSSALD